jgi:alginate O-acetyltransferase complex protein AlgI
LFFNDYLIFIYVVTFVITYNVAKQFVRHVFFKNLLLFSGNLFMLLTLVKEHTIIVLSILSLLVFVAGVVLQRRSSGSFLAFCLTVIIVLFSIRNYPYIHDQLSTGFWSYIKAPIMSVQKLGLSYILFRFVHYLVESYRKNIHRAHFFTFLNYILFFPTILAGPIDTYNNYNYWLRNNRKGYERSLFFAGITRIFFGAVKTIGIVPLVIGVATDYNTLIPDFSPALAVFLSLIAYSAYIYLDFSGYSDIAIGTAYLIGIKTPENFNNPYISTSLSVFWKRWHITFSNFLKAYVFMPSIKFYNLIFQHKYRLTVTILCYLTTFVICGLWHGDSINFLYWGLWHGIGLSINKLWQVKVKPLLPISKTYAYMIGSVLITFLYVTVGWVFFHYSHEELLTIYELII